MAKFKAPSYNGEVQLMETDSSNMTVPGPHKLLDWVGHMTNIIVLTKKQR